MKRRLAVSALGYSVVSGVVAGMAVVAVPYIFKESGVSIAVYGVGEAASLVLSSSALAIAWRAPPRLLALASSMAGLASWVAVSTLKPLPALAGYVAWRVAASLLSYVYTYLVLAEVERFKASALGLLRSAGFASSLAGPLAAIPVLELAGPRASALVLAVVWSFLAPISALVRPRGEAGGGSSRGLCLRGGACFFAVLLALGAIPGSMFMAYEDIIGVYIGGFKPRVIGTYEALEAVLIVILGPAAGYLVDRMRRRSLLPALTDSLAIPYATLLFMGAAAGNPYIYLSSTIPDALLSSLSTASTVLLSDVAGPEARLVLATYNSLSDLIAAAFTVAGGAAIEAAGPLGALEVIVVATIAIVAVDLAVAAPLYSKLTGTHKT